MKEFKRNHSVERAFSILECFCLERQQLDLGEIAATCQLSKSTVYRMLQTMIEMGYVKQNPATQKYSLGFKLFRLGAVVSADFNLKEAAVPYMKQLCDEISETINLNILHESDRVCIDIVESREAIRSFVKVGERHHLTLGPSGRVMLAFLPEPERNEIMAEARRQGILPMEEHELLLDLSQIRSRGYATENSGRVQGAFAITTPIFDFSKRPIGSITASGPIHRFTEERIGSMIDKVVRAGKNISEAMGASYETAHLSL